MKKVIVFALVIGTVFSVGAAPRGRGNSGSVNNNSGTVSQTSQGNVAARSAVKTNGGAPKAVAARSATPVKTSAKANTNSVPVIAARAASTQKVINSGTKISTATANTVVSEECKTKYYGCMDSFCMLDNTNGGRCLCSDRNAELDSVLAEIEKLDQQSYAMATTGLEQIEMGDDAADAVKRANSVADSLLKDKSDDVKKVRKALDLSKWNTDVDFEFDDIDVFTTANAEDDLLNKTGDALHNSVIKICSAQMPACSSELPMLKMMYAQQIKSDCSAYENSLKVQKNSSAQKLATAQSALREAALEQHRNVNKYDLGQCSVKFKECMQTTAGCKDDFTGCVGITAAENAKQSNNKKANNSMYTISGTISNISITAASYDTLVAKKPLCESVTKQCAKVADKVWDTFLRDIAPTIKTAELTAESDLRMNCISNISSCFQKACKDTMDPNDPDGSYDMCLTRPETMVSLCRVQLEPCLTATGGSMKKPTDSSLWDYVVARLASMRVDSCTKEVKSCLQSKDRCGEDYSQCIGLDMSSIKALCPVQKLVGCQENGEEATWQTIDNIVQGIYLSIDNELLESCKKAVTNKMVEVCGDSQNCYAFEDDEYIGTDSLSSYKNNDGDYVINGLVSFGKIKVKKTTSSDDNVKFGMYELDINDYTNKIENADSAIAQKVLGAIETVQSKVNQKIALLTEDPTIRMCITGRDMKQIRGAQAARTTARYPNLLDSSIMSLINAGLEKANNNYKAKYNKYVEEALEKQNDDVKSVLCAAMASDNSAQCTKYRRSLTGKSLCLEYKSPDSLNVFNETVNGMSGDGYETEYIISGANINKLVQVTQSGHSTFIQKDDNGVMLGTITKSAVYSSATNTCEVTTVTTMCKDVETIITQNDICDQGGFSLLGGSGCKGSGGILSAGGSFYDRSEEYHGSYCSDMSEPVTTVSQIKM